MQCSCTADSLRQPQVVYHTDKCEELLPFMQLLTLDDTTELLYTNPDKAWYSLAELLDTKGHRGYIVFVKCLKHSVDREDRHIGHCDIIKEIDLQLKCKGLFIGKCTNNEGVQL